jgi:DNA invertase Pin-like site-specific DNA recombinase
VAYIRVSSEEQAKADRFSLPAQRKEIERHCQQRGWTLVKLYADEGHSAKGSDLSKRPQFRQMLEDVKSGTVRCDVIVTHTLDRYARNLVVALTTLADLHQHGITYSSVTESDFDYSNPDKRLHLSILAMFAEYFSEKLSQHTRKGKRERAASGRIVGGRGDEPAGREGIAVPPRVLPHRILRRRHVAMGDHDYREGAAPVGDGDRPGHRLSAARPGHPVRDETGAARHDAPERERAARIPAGAQGLDVVRRDGRRARDEWGHGRRRSRVQRQGRAATWRGHEQREGREEGGDRPPGRPTGATGRVAPPPRAGGAA